MLCEDTRRTRTLLDRHGIRAQARQLSPPQRGEAVDELLPRLEAGEQVALASDAGLPGVNDPGAGSSPRRSSAGLEVTVLPGAVAVETALVASGLVGERSRSWGICRGGGGALTACGGDAPWSGPVVAFESPRRLPGSLALARGGRSRAPGRGLPGADEALRGDRSRLGARGRCAVQGGAEGRDHARPRAVAAVSRRSPTRMRSQQSSS